MRKKEIRKLGRYKNYLKYLSHVRISTINTARAQDAIHEST